ncbi:TIR domain-containing protein [Bryocella elongata]|uniref:TIR domain-containing protein n=1 Tax=Bryocella elongata TaxID=863522 RepID=A0A1H6A118_9BACT|nr:toll/interleukin-1 receptor domain-containing protein [Bryocella elongata]SEG42418.1 TIR domain-containing protein [Bryocella elongata]
MRVRKQTQKPINGQTVRGEDLVAIAQRSPLVFVSHDSRDAALAEAFSKLLSGISAGMLKSFRSSDKKGTQGIEFGVEWYPEVMSRIDEATDVVCLLTHRSIERPWILYEAGVAKGKANTPVYGVALGISLSKASTGPFAQFQNCGDDAESLTKLVKQLLCRIPGAEPDTDTITMQVEAFRTKSAALAQEGQAQGPLTKEQDGQLADASVAKLFEEVKVMFRELPTAIARREERGSRSKFHRLPPRMMYQLISDRIGFQGDYMGLLILSSLFRDEIPWLYELGMDVYRHVTSMGPQAAIPVAQRLKAACDVIAHSPEIFGSREETFLAAMELRSIAETLNPSPRRTQAGKIKPSDGEEPKNAGA